jgi:hypothetical protein
MRDTVCIFFKKKQVIPYPWKEKGDYPLGAVLTESLSVQAVYIYIYIYIYIETGIVGNI